MTERQLEIHKGLKAIGPEIAQFYLDGIQIANSELGTKSNLLAHILREIDGGLRDIFEQKQLKNEFQKKLKTEDLEKLFNQFKEDYKNYDYLSDITFEDFKKEKGHVSSILVSFGFSFDHPLSAQYIKVVRWIAKYAHRSGAYNQPRNPKDIMNLWYEFEDVLSKLIGNYYALADRMDSILALDEPTQEILKTLPNLLNSESRFVYFFNGLKSRKWLIDLELALREKEFTNKNASNNEKNVWKHYSNIALIHEIKNDESVLRANFIDKNPSAKSILKNQKKRLTIPESILSRSSMIKAKYQNNLFNKENIESYILPDEIDYQAILKYLKKISLIYNWKVEEVGGRKPLYKSENILEYYAHLMNDWINSRPLNYIISNTIKYYIKRGSIWYNGSELPFDSKNPVHINIIINQVISDVDNLLRFKIKNYFENYYMILEERLGKKKAGVNWAEYLEYGTSDFKIIELQNIGLPRYLAQYVLKEHEHCFSFGKSVLTKIDKEKILQEMDKNIPEYIELKRLLD